jgi:hypothetical protein
MVIEPDQTRDVHEPALTGGARSVAEQIFQGAAVMVGVAITLMGLVGVIAGLRNAQTSIDDLLAVDAFVFLVSCLAAYLALRTRSLARARRYMAIADPAFVIGLIGTVGIGALVARDLI